MALKPLLKRGGLLAAANWPVVAIQFAAQATFQALLAVPVIGAAILVAVLLGADLAKLLQGSMREIFASITTALTSEPVALAAFVVAFAIALVGGSILMFLVKGGTIDVLLAADAAADAIEAQPIGLDGMRQAACFTLPRFAAGCSRLFRRYIALGATLMLVYLASGLSYLALVVYGYRFGGGPLIGWVVSAAFSAVALVLWITAVNLIYLLLQIVMAAEDAGLGQAVRLVAGFVRAEIRELGGIFLVVFGMVLAATFVSALAWSGVGLIAFVPLVGLAVIPIQLLALLFRGLVFEYIGLTAAGAYVTLYRRHAVRLQAHSTQDSAASPQAGLDSAAARSVW